MKKRKGKGGLSTLVVSLIWAAIVVGILLAALQLIGVGSIPDGFEYIKDKSLYYAECIPAGNCGPQAVVEQIIDKPNPDWVISILPEKSDEGLSLDEVALDREETPGYLGPSEGEPYVNNAGLVSKDSALLMLGEVQTISDEEYKNKDVDYSRREWKHWAGTESRLCWNIREEVLHRDAIPGTVLYVDRQKNSTTNYFEACAIGTPIVKDGIVIKIDTEESGEWICPYSGKIITDSSKIDIDHIIPLSNAAKNGGQQWSLEMKEQFANDPDNLLATSAKENRSKGDKGPGEYMPPFKAYRCQYAKSYATIAYKYGLTITESDKEALDEAINACRY